MREIESRLGFAPSRLSLGAFVAIMIKKLPKEAEFEFLGYTQVAEHHYKTPEGLDIPALKKKFLEGNTWGLGLSTPVKIFPIQGADQTRGNDENYPPGSGVPQWKLTIGQEFEVVALVKGNERVDLRRFL